MSGIDIDALTREVSPDTPSGEDLEYDPGFMAFEEKVKGKPEHQIGDTLIPSEEPDWVEVRDDALALLSRTKDLRVLTELTRALVHTDGLPGLRDGLDLIHRILEQYWESVHPQLDPDDGLDPTQRVNILMGLCDWEAMVGPVHRMPLVRSRALGVFSLRDIQLASGQLAAPEGEASIPEPGTIEAAFMDCELVSLEQDTQSAQQCIRHLDGIEAFLGDQVGAANAVGFRELRESLKEIEQHLSRHLVQRKGAVAEPAQEETSEQSVGSSDQPAAQTSLRSGGIRNDQDVIRTLDLLCEYYRSHEPSSPVPLLLARARRLVSRDFMEILRDLAPDGVAQADLIRGETDESQ